MRSAVEMALNNRFMVIALGLLLLVWGGISFHNLPVEAYPDVANNYVSIITQWPGRAAEEVEQQVTVPLPASSLASTFRFRFAYSTGTSSNCTSAEACRANARPGWYIDDVSFAATR